MVDSAAGAVRIPQMSDGEENTVLGRYGLQFERGRIMVSNTHPELKKLMSDTPWAASWGRVLKRFEGAYSGDEAKKFAGVRSRFVSVPYQG